MRDWLEGLDPRERLFVIIGAVISIVALFFVFVWTPLNKNHDTLSSDVDRWQSALTELRPLKGLAQSSDSAALSMPTGGQQTPVVIVDQTLRSRGLDRSLKRSQPTTSNGIRVEFENVAFDDLVLWLGDLSGQYSMHTQSANMSSSSQAGPGRINATLTLERSL